VWNAMTGETAAGPFTGHTGSVLSVAFSPDGQHIVSCSFDRTIRVWNAMTGETAAGPFTGHTGSVWSVAFSPVGQHIVSGSDDGTIRVWNAMTGGTAAGPFTGHTDSVRSVAFSPDGQHIVSGSYDGTIRVSNVTIGKTEAANNVDITDDFMINDEGWICGSKGELLMWIPSVHRECLHRPSTICISGKRGTSLNLSNFVHGRSWATCINTRYY
jgi:WD40 repeat protein